MKKSLIALAALSVSGAYAQSTVTLYGQADAGYTSVKSDAKKFEGITSSNRGSSLFGLTGSEDLGGGLKANFKIEASVALDSGVGSATNTTNQVPGGPLNITAASATATATANTGTTSDRLSLAGGQGITFNRWSYVGLSGGFGEFRIGREYTPAFNAMVAVDPLATNGIGNSLNFTQVLGGSASHPNTANASNGVSFETASFSGFKAKVMAYFGENAIGAQNTNWVNGKSGDGTSYHLWYSSGPILVGYGSQSTGGTAVIGNTCCTGATSATSGIPGKYSYSTLYGSYDLGVARLRLQTAQEELSAATATAVQARKSSSTLFGVSVPVSKSMTVNGSYVKGSWKTDGAASGDAKMIALQGMYHLSKRTDAYLIYSTIDNGTGSTTYGFGTSSKLVSPAAGATSSGFTLGVRHSF